MFERFFLVLASIFILLVPFVVKEFGLAEASSVNPASDFEWSIINGNKVRIDKYIGSSKNVVIPSEIDGREVTEIGSYSFLHNNLTSVDIPDSVTKIGSYSFSNNNLTSVDIPDSVTEIKYHAFSNNNLTSVRLSENLVKIHYRAFENNKIKKIDFPISLELIDYGAFENNELSGDLVLPEKIERILWDTFKNNNLDSVTIPNKEVEIFDFVGDPFKNNKSNPSDFTLFGIKDSDVERFADEYGYTFKQLDGEVIFGKRGDSTWKQNHSVKVDVYGVNDRKPLEYTWSTSTSTPSSGWKTFKSGENIELKDKTGEYYLHVRGTDLLNNTFNDRTDKFKIDNTNPSLSLSQSPSSDTNKDVTITAKGSDSHSGVKRIKKPNGSWTNGASTTYKVSSNGTYKFEVEDNAGNKASKSITINNIDKEKPSISLSNNGGNWARSHSTKITATDSDSGIEKVEYRWTTNSSFPSSGFSSTSSESTVKTPKESGKHYLHVRATDKAGNKEEYTSKVFKIDREDPQLVITPNTTDETHEDVILTVKGEDSYSGVKRIKTPDGKWKNKKEITYAVTENGTYEFEIEDNAGNTSTENITVDNINKTMSFEKPTIDDFGSVRLDQESKRVDISPIIVSDWRDGNNNWRLNISATRLTGTDSANVLPQGLIKFRGVEKISKLSGEGEVPSYNTQESYIDSSTIEVASGSNSRGEFEIRFVPKALEILIDPSTMKKGTYETEIIWELINAP